MKKNSYFKKFEDYVNENYEVQFNQQEEVESTTESEYVSYDDIDSLEVFETESIQEKVNPDQVASAVEAEIKKITDKKWTVAGFVVRPENSDKKGNKSVSKEEFIEQVAANWGKGKFSYLKISSTEPKLYLEYLTKGSLISKLAAGSGSMTVGESVEVEMLDEGIMDTIKKVGKSLSLKEPIEKIKAAMQAGSKEREEIMKKYDYFIGWVKAFNRLLQEKVSDDQIHAFLKLVAERLGTPFQGAKYDEAQKCYVSAGQDKGSVFTGR